MNVGEVDLAQILNERLNRQEAQPSRGLAKMLDPWEAVFAIFDRHAPNDVLALSRPFQFSRQQITQPL